MSSEVFVTLAFLIGLSVAYLLYIRRRRPATTSERSRFAVALEQYWFSDWGFDWLYDKLFVQPILWFARINKRDLIDAFYRGIAALNEILHCAFRDTETGRVRWYAAGIAAGAIVILAIALFL